MNLSITLNSQHEKPTNSNDAPSPNLAISHPKRLKRAPLPVFPTPHLICRLPYELLAHIFVLGAETDPMLPVTASHVCRTWRRLALRTPALWRRVTLDSRLDMWNERIRRAKACSLEVQFVPWFTYYQRRPRDDRRDMAAVQWYMHAVTPHIRRWRSLEIVFSDYSPYLWNAALSACCSTGKSVQAPLLEELTLLYRNNDDTKEFCLFSNYAPRLRSVTLDGIKLTWTPSLFRNLTFLDYTHHGSTRGYSAVCEVLDMLRVSHRLVELRLLFPHRKPTHYHSLPDPLETPPVVLSMLSVLRLRVQGRDIPFELAQITTLLHTPALKQLHLMDTNEWNVAFPSARVFFRSYAFPKSLRALFIEYGWCDGHVLSSILRAPPPIKYLVLRRSKMPPQIIKLSEIQ